MFKTSEFGRKENTHPCLFASFAGNLKKLNKQSTIMIPNIPIFNNFVLSSEIGLTKHHQWKLSYQTTGRIKSRLGLVTVSTMNFIKKNETVPNL